MDTTLTMTSLAMLSTMHSKKNPWCCLRVIASLVLGDFINKLLCILMEVNKIIYGNNEDVSDKLMDIFLLRSPGLINHMIQQVGATYPVFPQSYWTTLANRNSSSKIAWPNRFNIPCTQCLQCQAFMTNLELDGIKLILTTISKIISRWVTLVMWYKTKVYNTTTIWESASGCPWSWVPTVLLNHLNKQEFIIHNSVTQPIQYSL